MTDLTLPKTLAELWDDDLKRLFYELEFRWQTFALEYLDHGIGSKAYEKAYGITGPNAWSSASALLRHPKVRAFITAYRAKDVHRHEDDKEFIRSTYRAAMLADNSIVIEGRVIEGVAIPDHKTRVSAATSLAKLDGHNAAEKVQDDRFTELVTLMQTRGRNGKEKA